MSEERTELNEPYSSDLDRVRYWVETDVVTMIKKN
jgi:hypothetical protein